MKYLQIIKRIFVWSSLIIVAIFALIVGMFMYLADGMCANEIHKIYISQNKTYKAIVFQRDCGATTGFSTQISIIDIDDELENDSGNIYVTKGHPDEVAPTLKWIENNHLLIYNIKTKTEYKKENDLNWFDTIKISYQK